MLLWAIALASCVNATEGGSELEIPALKSLDVELSPESFWEDFQNYSNNEEFFQKWKTSRLGLRDSGTGETRLMYPAKWSLQQPYSLKSFRRDQTLCLETPNSPAMIGRVLPEPLKIGNGTKLVVQYETQLQRDLTCGGAFVKLLPPMDDSELVRYSGGSVPFEVIFGPDKCQPYTNEVHFGLKKTNPMNNKPELKLLTQAPISGLDDDKTVRLYTLIMDSKSQDFEIRVDGKVVKAGNLLDEGAFNPEFHAPEKVPDLKAKKPKNWDDRELIPDSDAVKPDYWDESEPLMIPDESDSKPKSWNEKMPEFIPEPNHSKPKWWEEDEDGEWVAPLVRNPECFKIAGCGSWKPKMVENPDYWGPWNPPLVENPNYRGKWKPPLIDNPKYFENSQPGNLENSIGAVLFEFWSGSKDLLFDNLYLGRYVEEAELLGNKTFIPKKRLQNQQIETDIIGQKGYIGQPKKPPTMIDQLQDKPNLFDRLADYGDILLQKFTEQSTFVQNFLGGSILVIILLITSYFYLKIVLFQQDYTEGLGMEKTPRDKDVKKDDEGADKKVNESKFEELEFEPQLEKVDSKQEETEKNFDPQREDLDFIKRKGVNK